MTQYQEDYSKKFLSQFDLESRSVKAKKIQKIIEDFSKTPLKNCRCLEVGCSTGININHLAEYCGSCVGIDIDRIALPFAKAHAKPNVHFLSGDAMHLPFRDEYFDIVVCNHVYEHVPDSHALMDEIFRVLKRGGFCYFAAGNKYSIIEPHYKLPFLSWLPRSAANLYLKITKKGTTYYEKHLSYFSLKRLVSRFQITDYTIRIIKDPERFGAEDMVRTDSSIQKIPGFLFQIIKPVIPTYIFILSKES